MKICQVCAVDFTLKKFLLPLIDAQLANGNDVVAVCSDGKYVQAMRHEGYKIDTIKITRSMNPIKHLYSIWMLYWYFRAQHFDIVHVHTPVAALIGRIAAKLAGAPLVVYTAHGFYFHDDMSAMKRRIHIALEKIAGRITDILFTQSAEDAKNAVDLNIMPREHIFAIGNGVDVERFTLTERDKTHSQQRAAMGIPKDAFVVGMIGRQVEEKGIVEFLQAARELAKQYSEIYFLLIGDRLTSDHANAVDEIIEQSKSDLGQRLILPGMRDDIPELLSAMDVFVLPSWREGMPRTIIEAMMMALPVVATNIRGSREEVVPEETGLLVPVRNSEQLAKAIERLFNQADWALELGQAGRKRALELYDERIVVNRQIELINRYIADNQNVSEVAGSGTDQKIKRIFDVLASIMLLLLLSAPMLAIATVIKLTSKGPAVYWSDRVGHDNVIFRMPKFRSMRLDTPDVATHLMVEPDDYLISVGGILRRYSLDEFPQLFSILKGDMSLVGPRPALYNQDDLVELRKKWGVDQLVPGLTGWAQVNGRDELPISQKVALDVEYMQRQSFLFDLKILMMTVQKVFKKDGVSH